MRRIFKKLSYKLIVGMVVILLGAHALTGVLTIRGVHENTLHYMDSIGQAICQTVANACIESFLLEDYPVLETYAGQLVRNNPVVVQIQYERYDNKVLARATQENLHDLQRIPGVIRYYSAPIATSADDQALGYVTVGISARKMQTLFRTHLLELLAILIVSLVIAGTLLVFLLERIVIGPLKKLAVYAYSIGAGDFDETISIKNQDEIGQLVHAIDEMKVNLKISYSAIQEQNQKLVSLDKMKSQFLANMSHEIRTPMNSIVGFSNMLAAEDLKPEYKDYIDVIRESSQNLLYLINDILDFSKIESGQLEIETIDCSLGKLLHAVESMMRPQADEKGLDFQILVNPEVPAQIRSDPYRLQQCLINLINNAIKFTDRGHVHLKAALRQDNQGYAICLAVEDTGIGIPAARQTAIFESFTQVDGNTTRKYGGTGLGLTVTRQLAELMGGELNLHSEMGKGSTFSLVIPTGLDIAGQPRLNDTGYPLPDPDNVTDQETNESLEGDAAVFSGKVLVAEDVEGNQKLMELMLSKLGLEVCIAEDGRQAVAKALSQPFDLIFMDIQMPYMNGYDATAALKQQGYPAPIVALTANAMKGDDLKCLEAGCDDYLPKPVDRRELPRLLAKYLAPGQGPTEAAVHSMADRPLVPETPWSNQALIQPPIVAPVEPDTDSVIDWDELIDKLGDEETVREIIPAYIKDIEAHIEQLTHAIEAGDFAGVASHAHALKGVGRNVGVDQLTDIAYQMECAGRERRAEACLEFSVDLSREAHGVLEALRDHDWSNRADPTQKIGGRS